MVFPGCGHQKVPTVGRRPRALRLALGRVAVPVGAVHAVPDPAVADKEIGAWARCHIEPGTVVVSDALGCFGAVRHAGCFHEPFVTGSGPASARHPALTWVNTILGNIKRSLHGTYHHLSSKHLPRYLAEFSYRFNRRFSLSEMFPRLAFVALRTAPMPYRVLKLAENYS